MQPNQMNQMMPSKHSHGNRTDPRSQRNQSYQSKQPVPTNTASTSIISNQSSQPTKSVKSSMQIINPFNKKWYGIGVDVTHHIGLYGIALDGNCLYFYIDCTGLGWVDLLVSIWFGWFIVDCVGYALNGFDLIHCGVSFHLLRLHLTWLGVQLITLIDWLFWFCFLSLLQYAVIWLPYKHWDLARGWMDWLVRVIDVIRMIGAIGFLTLNWIDWFSVGSVIFNCMWICCGWLWFDSLVSLMSFDEASCDITLFSCSFRDSLVVLILHCFAHSIIQYFLSLKTLTSYNRS